MSTRKKFETNSDIKTRQQFRIVKRTPRSDVVGVQTEDGKRQIKFDKMNHVMIDDPGLAREIHDSSGQGGDNWDVLVIPSEKPADPIHQRTFTVPALPWHENKE